MFLQSLSPSPIRDLRKHFDDEHERFPDFNDPKRFRLTIDPNDDHVLQSAPVHLTTPTESVFRTITEHEVPSVETKKDPSKTVTWSEELKTFNDVRQRQNTKAPQ